MWLVVTSERADKTRRIMAALHDGSGRTWRLTREAPPRGEPFIVWGHRWIAEEIVPQAIADGTEWWLIDNGYHEPAGRGPDGWRTGYYSLTRNGVSPAVLQVPDCHRLKVPMQPWKRTGEGYILIALPGRGFGRMLGFNTDAWIDDIYNQVRKRSRRQIVIREKGCSRPLALDLAGAYVLVTHSSKVAVDAVLAGVPVVVEPTNPAAPVGRTTLDRVGDPIYPSRERWWASLMRQQFTLEEMRSGRAKAVMDEIRGLSCVTCESSATATAAEPRSTTTSPDNRSTISPASAGP